jgi:cell division protein FtsZ
MAISVTVIATGFEERRKPKGPTTVKLNEDNFDTIAKVDPKEDEVKIAIPDALESSQQTLLLDDEIIFELPTEETPEAVEEEVIDSLVESKNTSKMIVFDLENEDVSIDDNEESADEVISSVMIDEEPVSVQQTVALELEDEVMEEEPTLNTIETAQVNTKVMKVESREREDRLRNISMQLRTPSGLTSLEDVPAYKRNNIEISEPTHSSESEASSYTLTNGNNNTTELKQNNSFLHDNVD